MSSTLDATVARLHREAPFTDVHAHPSLKAWLYRRNLWRHYRSGKSFNPVSSRSDFKCLERGGVGVLWAAHYLPERQLFRDCRLARAAAAVLVPKHRRLLDGSLFERLLEMMDALEREIERRPEKTELALSAADAVRIRQAGKIAVVHTVEGAHVLEGDSDNLDKLAERGVAMLTLCHFYPNELAAHVDGIPKKMFLRKLCKFRFGDHGSPRGERGVPDRSVRRRFRAGRSFGGLGHRRVGRRRDRQPELGLLHHHSRLTGRALRSIRARETSATNRWRRPDRWPPSVGRLRRPTARAELAVNR